MERSHFRSWSRGRWFNVAFAALALCYIAYAVATLELRGVLDHIGLDFRTFYCSAKIAWSEGFAGVYDLGKQDLCQRPLYQAYATGPLPGGYVVVPTPYLPPFLLPFLALLPLGPVPGFAVWTVLNAAGLVLYLRRFTRAMRLPGPAIPLPIVLSFAAYTTLFLGQVNVWMLICLGEFLLASRQGRELRAGLWLGGLLLKPQFLVLFGLGLLVGRRWRALAGLALAGGVVLVLSLALAGPAGLVAVAQLLLRYPGPLASTAPEWMMNWRALAVNLGQLLPPVPAWSIAMAGLALTVAAALWLWLHAGRMQSLTFAVAVLGTAAASCTVAWHAHTHGALFLAAPLLLLQAEGGLPRNAVNLWAALPALIYFSLLLSFPGVESTFAGLSMLGINVYLLAWSGWAIWHRTRPGQEDSRHGPGPS
jgi:hypothetical protein